MGAERGDVRFEDGLGGDIVEGWRAIFARQRAFAEHAIDQLDLDGFFWSPGAGLNSVAVITRHRAGNMKSRWTGFLTEDGEKAWRDRDEEFVAPDPTEASRDAIMAAWREGWAALDSTLGALTEADLGRTVTIRGAPHAVHAAVLRQIDHYAFHVGQMNVIARLRVGSDNWAWFTLAPGGTKAFNEAMRAKHGG